MNRELTLTGYGSFVGRQAEINSFTSDLERLGRLGYLNANVREYYGPHGMGKSELLHQFAIMAQQASIPHAYIDFANLSTEDIEKDPTVLFDEFTKSLIGLTDQREYMTFKLRYKEIQRPSDIVAAYAQLNPEVRLYQRPKWLDAMRDYTVGMIKVANQLGKDRNPQVLIFDNVQHVGIDAVDFIEEWIVNPLVQVPGLMAMWADRRPWRWKRPEIRRRLNSNELKPLSKVEVGEWVKTVTETVVPAQIETLHRITGGNPGALQDLASGGYIYER